MQAKALVRGDPEGDLDEPLPAIRSYCDYVTFGLMPFAGGTFDQPADLMRDFRIISSAVATERKRLNRQR